jgi:hypothetical protein
MAKEYVTNEITTLREREVSKPKEEIIKEAKRLYENCLYTSKSHFVDARFWQKLHLWIGVPSVILSGVAGTLAFTSLTMLAGILSIVIVALTAITTFLVPKEQANSHFTAANNYDSLMVKLRIFWSIDCWREESDDILSDRLRAYCKERDKFNRESPQSFKWSYQVAKQGIQEGESEYLVDNKG